MTAKLTLSTLTVEPSNRATRSSLGLFGVWRGGEGDPVLRFLAPPAVLGEALVAGVALPAGHDLAARRRVGVGDGERVDLAERRVAGGRRGGPDVGLGPG